MILDPQSIQPAATYLSASTPDLIIREAGTDPVTVTMAISATIIYNEVLRPSDGTVVVADLARLVTAALEGSLVASLSITATDSAENNLSLTATIYYSRVRVREVATDFLASRFLSLTTRRTSRIGFSEMLFAFLTDEEFAALNPLTATATAYYADGTTASFPVPYRDLSTTAPNLVAFDVSLAQFRDPDYAADIARVVVTLGQRTMTIDTDFSPAICRGHLRFVNAFGLPDVVHILGRITEKTTFARSAGWFAGHYRQYDAQETLDRELSSGYVDDDAYTLWLDCARTTSLAIFPHPNTDEVRVLPYSSAANAVITAEKFEHSDEDDALHIVTLTVRPSSRFPELSASEPFRIFDATFDNTFN